MIRLPAVLAGAAAALAAALPGLAHAQTETAQQTARVAHPDTTAAGFLPAHAVGLDVFASTDADDTDVIKFGANLDWRYRGPDDYLGLRVETARFKPLGGDATEDQRLYLRFADKTGDWSWKGQVGTDGDTVLGSASVHNEARFRQEYFVEREILETPRGLDEGVYYTFVGGAFDLPVDDRNNFTVVAGVQDFTGSNVRTHLRLNYIHVVKPEWGLSAQVRTRYFHSSDPGEYDYFSPENYFEIMPVLQVRRYHGGWRYVVAAGVGGQKETGGDWRSARYFNAQVVSPPLREWAINAGFTYSNTPVASGYTYDYSQVNFGVVRAF
ncbi:MULTISPECIES: hypothetical protein [unclassified Brevundimonas]|uniref:hypothetical protein n=1 Tax=unclassified Brevundimonas TaxID=2622653 RepID=UPI000CFDCC53|nr:MULTISPECIES: hypothetical protein [unclassified Brevundimonas]PRA33334.1 hypothetical protein CQ024_05035 [Brevundimonas sp. MYb27]PQZ83827.1 hypothetical protein CQ026_03270 [Brevundimonas sp. MYb31]PRB13756.1 hypothetical protein CQ039_11460 [Brevundimonas sp. MYb52]PRB34511.1 hypothetical protein CQ035_10865 [Brevundimonas sp. MYb46]PRB53989.1 hypothetical protein CQ028_05510 [Brevundimonas sp. MYb33]